MKIVLITGNHPRHSFLARAIAQTEFLSKIVIEEREHFVPEPPDDIDRELKELFRYHFTQRKDVEDEVFGSVDWPDVDLCHVSAAELNCPATHEILREGDYDLLISYGCQILSYETLSCVDGERWNCHGGLSPWYRGTITHFWPSYMLEPQMTGMTVHQMTQDVDGGDIVHQCVADMVRGDGLHRLAARAVTKLCDEIPQLIRKLAEEKTVETKKQTTSGMLWLTSKWRPEHLRVVYQLFNDRIVDSYIDGKFQKRQVKLHRQF